MYKKHYSVDRLLKNVDVLQVGTGKNPTTLIVKQKNWKFYEQKKYKNNKKRTRFLQVLIM